MYLHLNPDKTVATIETLEKRIKERFPTSGLSELCAYLNTVAAASRQRAEWIARPNLLLRGIVAVIVVLSLVVMVYSVSLMEIKIGQFQLGELVQITEAGLNNIVLIGAAIFFLVTVETRIKRSRALAALHELRAIAHVIDMHQLTKDPGRIKSNISSTPSSPKLDMSAYELTRYLDYCSEMLSLTGKIAALYAQNFRDAIVVSAVNELETLTTGLSQKIWQKIMILHRLSEA